ncbi:hypothetical protein [Methanobrevibacter sp.]|uniref:hypothetical protein n=1 Tax=Methanobrevibacter sp. TaxID=66852 RepID=UPI00388DE1D4
MSKTCPNCGVNSPDNAKFCIECAYDLTDVPVNKVKEEEKPVQKPPASSDSEKGNVALGCIIMIVIVIAIAAVGFFVFGSGGSENSQQNITITFDQVYVDDYDYDGKTHYSYNVNGYILNYPSDDKNFMVKTIYYNSNGSEITSSVKKLSDFKDDQNYNFASTLGSYYTENYVDIDHVSVQIIKDNTVLNEFNSTMNKNKLTHAPNSGNTSK